MLISALKNRTVSSATLVTLSGPKCGMVVKKDIRARFEHLMYCRVLDTREDDRGFKK